MTLGGTMSHGITQRSVVNGDNDDDDDDGDDDDNDDGDDGN